MTTARKLDLNGDVGEGVGDDAALIPLLTSANVACGGHAGDAATMRSAIRIAVRAGVAVGAHPGHWDRAMFGRVERRIKPHEVRRLVIDQFGVLMPQVRLAGCVLAHVKPHGALYHQLARELSLAEAFVDAVAEVDAKTGDPAARRGRPLMLFGPAGSALERAAATAGLPFIAEGFADRTYRPDGTLTPRTTPGALIDDEEQAVAQVLSMVRSGVVRAVDGSEVRVRAETLSVHGDGPHALAFARRLRSELAAAGITLAAPTKSILQRPPRPSGDNDDDENNTNKTNE
ncbi:MAG: LamB/YcsF family protein [Planctomycetes bacterium]|nr:LamB/YcsF family protein [Planctomycetota bacterium]